MRPLVASLLLLAFARGDAIPPLIAGRLTLWAWERPDDLRWLAGTGVGVALLERTLTIRDGVLRVDLRRQPLRVALDSPLTAVVRVDTDGRAVDLALLPRVVDEIADAARMPRATTLQIDFDARRSERGFYAALLREVRAQVRPPMRLSMTALASWCADDPWIDTRDVDEIVPMLFQMGPDARRIVTRLQEQRRFPVAGCNDARGVSTGEPLRGMPPAAMTYIWREGDALTAQHISAVAASARGLWWDR